MEPSEALYYPCTIVCHPLLGCPRVLSSYYQICQHILLLWKIYKRSSKEIQNFKVLFSFQPDELILTSWPSCNDISRGKMPPTLILQMSSPTQYLVEEKIKKTFP